MASKNKDEWILLSNDRLFSSWLSHVGLQNLRGLDYCYESTQALVVKKWTTAAVDTSDKQRFDKKMIKIQFRVTEDKYYHQNKEIWIDLNKINEYEKILMPPFYHNDWVNSWKFVDWSFDRTKITFANNLVRDDIGKNYPVFFKLNNKWQLGHVMSYDTQLNTFMIQRYNELDINKYYKYYINNLIMKPTIIVMPIEGNKFPNVNLTFDFEWFDDDKSKNYYNRLGLNDCNSIYPCKKNFVSSFMAAEILSNKNKLNLSEEEIDYVKNLIKLIEYENKNRKTVDGKYFDNIIGNFKNSLYCDHFFMSKNELEYLVYGVYNMEYNNYNYKYKPSKTHLPIDLCNIIVEYFGINDSYSINYHCVPVYNYQEAQSPERRIRLLLFNTLNNIISNKNNIIRIKIIKNDLHYEDKHSSNNMPSKIEFGIIGIKNNKLSNVERDALFNFIYNQNTHKTYETYLDIASLVKHLKKLNMVFKIYMITFGRQLYWNYSKKQSCEYNYIENSTIDKHEGDNGGDSGDAKDIFGMKGMTKKPMKLWSDDSDNIFYNWNDDNVDIVVRKQYKQEETVSSLLTFFKNDINLFKHDFNNTFKDGFVQIDSNLRFYPFVTVNDDCTIKVSVV